MSSPAGLPYSQADFLARCMPSSTRAGVILNPCPDLAGSLRYISSVGTPQSPHLEADDSFHSDFAPLPASADSSCLCLDSFAPGGARSAADRPANGLYSAAPRNSDGELDSLDEMASKFQELPLMMRLEQLRKWQQRMQEQLKAHQLEELLCLQEEQQKLLGIMNPHHAPQHCIDDHRQSLGHSGAEWEEDTLQGGSHYEESSYSPITNCGPQQEWLPSGQNHEEANSGKEGMWSSREDMQEQINDFQKPDAKVMPRNGVTLTEDDGSKEDTLLQDRPIKPGIGGQKQTFEDLLEEQLRLEEQRLKSSRKQQRQDEEVETVKAPSKRTFLKRGEGLSRFTNNRKGSLTKEVTKNPKTQPQARGISRSNSEPAAIQRGTTKGIQRLPVQRKTAILNKENRLRGPASPPQDIRVESKAVRTNVLGSHQKQNTGGAQSIQSDPDSSQTKLFQPEHVKEWSNIKVGQSAQTALRPGQSMQPNPVTKQVGMFREPGSAGNDAAERGNNVGPRREIVERRTGTEGEEGVPQDSFELSFQEKLKRWECDLQVENMELGEFELLEQAADELSFSSNSSFVMKVLQMDQQHRQLHGAMGLHQRRLSSTPIKSPPGDALQRSSSDGSGSDMSCKSNSVLPEAKIKDKMLRNKVSIEDKEEHDGGREEQHKGSAVLSCGGPVFKQREVLGQPPVFPSTLCFPASTNPPYDKRSYQDEDGCRDSASDVTQDEEEDDDEDDDDVDEESNTILSHTDNSTLIEDKEGCIVFDDDDTWNDSRGVSPVSKETAPERTVQRKVAGKEFVDLDRSTVTCSASQEPDPPPPASQLMARLFPSLKPKTQNTPLPSPPAAVTFAASEARKEEDETGQQVQSIQLRERLAELEIEIERFKKENTALTKLRQENEKKQESLRKEHFEFMKTKAEELAKFEEYKKEENRKLQKERKLFEKHASAARAIPDKKEREEIQELKQQLSSLQEELKRRESRWSSTHSRLRQQMESLSQENSSLREEVRMLEKLRLSAWKKNPVDAEKDKEIKEVPSVAKGVKFANPLDSRGSSNLIQSSTAAATRGSSLTAAAGKKSNLRKPAPGRRTEEKSTPASESHSKPPSQETSHSFSPKRSSLPDEPECSGVKEPESAQDCITHPDGKIEKVLDGGDRLIIFPNGTRKEVSGDGLTIKVTFFNGDTKQITADQRVIYYYAEAQTTHITYPDGMEVLHFPNNQTEKHFQDGRKEITFPDQTVKNLFPDGREESVLTDGTIIQVNPDGTKEIHFNTGQKEVHTADFKRREYPDGTIKTVYTDGRQETRYPTGRLRIKDKDGNIILDNKA